VLEYAGFCCEFVEYIVEWTQSRGTLVWHGQSKGLVALLLGVEGAWVQFMMQDNSACGRLWIELCTCRRLAAGGACDIVGRAIRGSVVSGVVGFLIG
jgi:hypothetical protein